MDTLKKTILYDKHLSLNAKMSEFGGYLMPIQYDGIIKEHTATRTHATIFDTCHMGEFLLKGPDVITDLERILSCPVASLKIGQCRYGFICNEKGGVIDDQIIYRLADNEFFMVVNASTEPNDFAWVKSNLSPKTSIENLTAATAKLDIQGPESPKIFQRLLKDPINDMKYYHFKHNFYNGEKVLISRTGYTGEIGFEIYCSPESGLKFWDDCLSEGVSPAGLGARDTLRLEMGYPLYGHELDENTNAAESGFTRAIGENSFIGSFVVKDHSKTANSLCGVQLEGRRASRHGDTIANINGEKIGRVTSGSFSPSLQQALAIGYVKKEYSTVNTPVKIITERGELQGKITSMPFYTKATGRANISDFL
jgi:aminomethyltransferase